MGTIADVSGCAEIERFGLRIAVMKVQYDWIGFTAFDTGVGGFVLVNIEAVVIDAGGVVGLGGVAVQFDWLTSADGFGYTAAVVTVAIMESPWHSHPPWKLQPISVLVETHFGSRPISVSEHFGLRGISVSRHF